MHLTLELPDTVVALLGEAPERTIYRLIKAHLAPAPAPAAPRGRRISNAERDATIADQAVAGKTHAAIANEHKLSTIRVSQIVAAGKAAALIRNPKPIRNNTKPLSAADILRDWSRPEPTHTTTNPNRKVTEPIHNTTLDLTIDF